MSERLGHFCGDGQAIKLLSHFSAPCVKKRFVDAASFALMRRKRIAEALAFDGGFSAAGFIEIRP